MDTIRLMVTLARTSIYLGDSNRGRKTRVEEPGDGYLGWVLERRNAPTQSSTGSCATRCTGSHRDRPTR
jgi:hypothetical protein